MFQFPIGMLLHFYVVFNIYFSGENGIQILVSAGNERNAFFILVYNKSVTSLSPKKKKISHEFYFSFSFQVQFCGESGLLKLQNWLL